MLTRRRALFLDRDGVINVDYGYVHKADNYDFVTGLFPFLRKAQDHGYRLVVVTNQAGVAKGYYKTNDFDVLTDHMLSVLSTEGISVDRVMACFTHPVGEVVELNRDSYWRKPNPGMILEAALRLGLDISSSVMIGDRDTDMMAGIKAGVAKALWLTPERPDLTPFNDKVVWTPTYLEADKALFGQA